MTMKKWYQATALGLGTALAITGIYSLVMSAGNTGTFAASMGIVIILTTWPTD